MRKYLLLTAVVVLLQVILANAQTALGNAQVASGNTQTEYANPKDAISTAQTAIGQVQATLVKVQTQAPANSIVLQLSSSVFSDSFQLIFKTGGNVEIDDQDALKVSEGYVSISSLHPKGSKLAIEERAFPIGEEEVGLVVKGYASGQYHLKITAVEFATATATTTNNNTGVTLFDKFMNKMLVIPAESTIDYPFTIDSALIESQGDKRFSLLLSKVSLPVPVIDSGPELLAYPNPFQHHLFINVKDHHTPSAEVRIKDLTGRLVWQKAFKDVQMNAQLELDCQNLYPGLYLLEWSDHTNPKKSRTLKIIKQ